MVAETLCKSFLENYKNNSTIKNRIKYAPQKSNTFWGAYFMRK